MTGLLAHPLGWPALTVLAFLACTKAYERLGRPAILQPVLVTIVLLSGALLAFGIPYAVNAEPTRLMTLWLAPAIVALAVPLYENLAIVRQRAGSVAATVLAGSTLVMFAAVGLGMAVGLSPSSLLPLLTKSVSAPIALGIAGKTGASVELTILCVFSTGLPGAVVAPTILRWMGVHDEAMRGLVLGLTCHAFGIARATEIGPRATAFATIGMGLMGCLVALAVPLVANVMVGP